MRIKFIFIVLLMVLLNVSACSRAEDQSNSTENLAADFTLENLAGGKIVLSDILKDKIVVLDFWATWCGYCVTSIPQIEKFYKENKNKVEVIGINIKESKAKVADFVRKKGITYPIALDSKADVAKLYKVRGIPTIVAVDKDSRILYYGHSIEEMKSKIK